MATAEPRGQALTRATLAEMPVRLARRRTLRDWLRAAWKLRLSVLGGLVLLLLLLIAIAAPVLTPYTPSEGRIVERLQPPVFLGGSWEHPLGTDGVGRDYATRLMYGARVALAVGVLSTLVATAIGVCLGILAGYYSGKVDWVISTLVNIMMTFPFILLALAVIAVLGPSFLNVVLVLGIGSWPIYARVVRVEVSRIKALEFVAAARVIGLTDLRIIGRHIVPNLVNAIIVIGTVQIARLIITEAFLSYLGLGVQPPTPSWGYMLFESQAFMFNPAEWWLPMLPGLAIFITTLAINLVGDGLRDVLDPYQRSSL
ncbi:ABC transporter permease [Thermomicrobiaceae bacterium CFH 74404]|uniref:ABC transporter permease n=1 Tax=Thermalbibacter longus TaxID=2951981 RepID=A0AA42BAL5_9BACT|nr:ABC transporter permease [Thermalbibacter longus]MCM8748754.1 ABC transporter permease [Thermalbibacter longus]